MDNTSSNNSPAGNTATPKSESPTAEMKQAVRNEIRARWGKFSEKEMTDLKGNDDLVTQIVAKYGTNKFLAQRDVDVVLKGRQI